MSLVVFGIDPGKTTGWCAIGDARWIASGETPDTNHLLDMIKVFDPNVVVIELYIHYPWIKVMNRSWSAEVSGAVKKYCEDYGIKVVEQNAAARVVITNIILDAAEVPKPVRKQKHALDAILHALTYIWRVDPEPLAKKAIPILAKEHLPERTGLPRGLRAKM